MLRTARQVRATGAALHRATILARSYVTDHPVPANEEKTRSPTTNVSSSNEIASTSTSSFDRRLKESTEAGEEYRIMQAPNREGIWSRSQRPREVAMSGPRFEQTIMADQPRSYAAIDLIHKQPVRWTNQRIVACDGGGGPTGHPRIFINTDKPQICWCTYCGVPYAHEHHRKHLESLPSTSYPLESRGDPAEVLPSQHPTGKALEQR